MIGAEGVLIAWTAQLTLPRAMIVSLIANSSSFLFGLWLASFERPRRSSSAPREFDPQRLAARRVQFEIEFDRGRRPGALERFQYLSGDLLAGAKARPSIPRSALPMRPL